MTTERRDGLGTPFCQWVREHPELESHDRKLCVQDCDLWIHRFSERDEKHRNHANDIRELVDCIALVEIKTFMSDMPFAQRDTLQIVGELLYKRTTKKNGDRNPIKIPDWRRHGFNRSVRWYGVHLLQMDHDRPDSSALIRWDCHSVSEQVLIEILRFDRDPEYPGKFIDTRRHHRQRELPLFSYRPDVH